MDNHRLGRSGLIVSEWGLGTMMFGAAGSGGLEAARSMVDLALDHGVNLVDTADAYAGGESERMLGEVLRGRRDEVLLATKVHMPTGSGPNDRGNSRYHIMHAVEASLRRLGTDHIDLYQVHRPDPDTDVDETLGALTDLVRQGKVGYLGTSAFPAHLLMEAAWVSERRHREPFAVEQAPYSVFARAVEAEVLPTCQRLGMGVLSWSPLAGGWLAGRYRRDAPAPAGSRAAVGRVTVRYYAPGPTSDRKHDLVERLAGLADESGLSLLQLALGFVRRHPAVTCSLLGPRTPEQLATLLEAGQVRLDDDVMDAIDEIVAPGTDVNPLDVGYRPPELTDASRRRR